MIWILTVMPIMTVKIVPRLLYKHDDNDSHGLDCLDGYRDCGSRRSVKLSHTHTHSSLPQQLRGPEKDSMGGHGAPSCSGFQNAWRQFDRRQLTSERLQCSVACSLAANTSFATLRLAAIESTHTLQQEPCLV